MIKLLFDLIGKFFSPVFLFLNATISKNTQKHLHQNICIILEKQQSFVLARRRQPTNLECLQC